MTYGDSQEQKSATSHRREFLLFPDCSFRASEFRTKNADGLARLTEGCSVNFYNKFC